ncbi:MAG: M23 family metallopeptidase [Magnetospirillum sp.]|nr:M23 family metallopeptidase [Magnetospirillum sp.]
MRIHVTLALLLVAGPAWAEAPRLSLPLECRLGEDCWVMNYPDTDPSQAARDFTCRPRSYNLHDGTDFALRDIEAMRRGVPVRAAAAGKVIAVRDGEEDGLWLAGRKQEVLARTRECGNRVSIAHGDGWVTDYCHMRKGSIRVQKGQMVETGQPLGLVGLSGMTDFPHAHMGVLRFAPGARKGVPVDPYTGAPLSEGCGRPAHPLWAQPQPYESGSLYAAGVADHVPGKDIKQDAAAARRLPADAPALVVWGSMFGAARGDTLRIQLTAPDGRELVDNSHKVDGDQAWRVSGTGKKRPPGGWAPGTYRGRVTLARPGQPPQSRDVSVEVGP